MIKSVKNPFFLIFEAVICCISILVASPLFSQQTENWNEQIEFLSQDTFEELSRAYDTSESSEMAQSFAKAFLLKAKGQGDSLKMAEGYFKIAHILPQQQYPLAKQYLDSAIASTQAINNNLFPAKALIYKANINGAQGNYKEAMDNLTIASSYATKAKNTNQKNDIKYFVAILKGNIGEFEEGLTLLRDVEKYRKSQFLKD